MKVPNMNKEFFLRNYNYHFRFVNIKRKISDYQLNAEKLQEVMETIYKPIKIKGVLREKGKKIFEHEGIFLTMISDVIEGPTKIRKKYYMLSKKEQIKYLLLLEIISEATQYCADLAAIMISLRDFNKNKLSIVDITDTYLKEWYVDFNKPTIETYLEILRYPPIQNLDREQGFYMRLKHEKLRMMLKLIGAFYHFHYDNIYIPYRHGMRIFLQKDEKGVIYFFGLSKEGNFRRIDLKKDILKQCESICEFIYEIFDKNLRLLLETKIFERTASKKERNIGYDIPIPKELPIITFDTDIINRRLNLSNEITIHHFLVNDIQTFLKFNSTNQLGIEINYNKSQKDKNRIIINGLQMYFDDFWSLVLPIKQNEYIFLSCCPLAYSIEVMRLKLLLDPIYSQILQEIKDSIKFFITAELKDVLNEPIYSNLPVKRDIDINYLENEIHKIAQEITVLIGFHYFKDFFDNYGFKREEIEFLVDGVIKKIVFSIHLKDVINKIDPEKGIFCLLNILILKFLSNTKDLPEKVKDMLDYPKLAQFLSECDKILIDIVKNNLEFDYILRFMNIIYDHTKLLINI